MGAVTPGETLGTLYNIRVGSNKTKQHTHRGGAPARALRWRCACLRCARLRLPCSRCVYLLCVRLLCTCRPDRQYASPVRAGKPARTGAVRQAEICCFGGFAWGVVPLCRYSEVGAKDLRVLR